ncbi:hypothetical protein WJM93_15690 [Lactiplantibacillus plantarum]
MVEKDGVKETQASLDKKISDQNMRIKNLFEQDKSKINRNQLIQKAFNIERR